MSVAAPVNEPGPDSVPPERIVAPFATPPASTVSVPPLETVVRDAVAPDPTNSTPPLRTVAFNVSRIAPLSKDAPLSVVVADMTDAEKVAPLLMVKSGKFEHAAGAYHNPAVDPADVKNSRPRRARSSRRRSRRPRTP